MKVMLEGLLNSIKYWKKDGCRHFFINNGDNDHVKTLNIFVFETDEGFEW